MAQVLIDKVAPEEPRPLFTSQRGLRKGDRVLLIDADAQGMWGRVFR